MTISRMARWEFRVTCSKLRGRGQWRENISRFGHQWLKSCERRPWHSRYPQCEIRRGLMQHQVVDIGKGDGWDYSTRKLDLYIHLLKPLLSFALGYHIAPYSKSKLLGAITMSFQIGCFLCPYAILVFWLILSLPNKQLWQLGYCFIAYAYRLPWPPRTCQILSMAVRGWKRGCRSEILDNLR